MYHVLTTSAIFVLLAAPSASAFFGAFDALEEEFERVEGKSGNELQDILVELEEASGSGFRDVAQGQWYHQYVSSVARWGIVSGYKDSSGNPTGRFGPGDPVTIAEILKMAMEAGRVDESACTGTPSLAQARNHWARSYVACAEQRSFRMLRSGPDLNRAALRGEVLAIIHDAFGDRVPPLFSTFKDAANHPFESDIAYAAALGVVSGDKDAAGVPTGRFRPDSAVNRAEAAKIIYEKLRVEVMGEG